MTDIKYKSERKYRELLQTLFDNVANQCHALQQYKNAKKIHSEQSENISIPEAPSDSALKMLSYQHKVAFFQKQFLSVKKDFPNMSSAFTREIDHNTTHLVNEKSDKYLKKLRNSLLEWVDFFDMQAKEFAIQNRISGDTIKEVFKYLNHKPSGDGDLLISSYVVNEAMLELIEYVELDLGVDNTPTLTEEQAESIILKIKMLHQVGVISFLRDRHGYNTAEVSKLLEKIMNEKVSTIKPYVNALVPGSNSTQHKERLEQKKDISISKLKEIKNVEYNAK